VGDLPVDDAGYRRLAWLADGTILGVTYGHGVVVIRGAAVSRLLTHTISHDLSARGDRVLIASEDGVWEWDGATEPVRVTDEAWWVVAVHGSGHAMARDRTLQIGEVSIEVGAPVVALRSLGDDRLALGLADG